jgi:hypothetical protein
VRRLGWVAPAASIVLLLAGPARAQSDKDSCIAAHFQAQKLQIDGHWREAQRRFQTCLAATCPPEIVQDCSERYEALRKAIPTVLVAARGPDGMDTIDARLVIDGKATASPLPSVGVEMDPGEHVLRVEHEGWLAAEQRIVLREHEKDRRVMFEFTAPKAREPAKAAAGPDVLGLALTVGGGIVTVVGAGFVAWGLVQRGDLLGQPCAPTRTCSPDDVGAIDRSYWTGGIALGVGLVALGIGIWELSSHRERPAVSTNASGVGFSF